MTMIGTFPFGQPVHPVIQQDHTPKKVFVLGVYASAVHAEWIGTDGERRVNALAVASEPYIFWRGDNAEEIIANINIPTALGKLIPAAKNLNGPSGNALDDLFLSPLGITRDDAWLCDLVPHSCLNQKQKKAILLKSLIFQIGSMFHPGSDLSYRPNGACDGHSPDHCHPAS